MRMKEEKLEKIIWHFVRNKVLRDRERKGIEKEKLNRCVEREKKMSDKQVFRHSF